MAIAVTLPKLGLTMEEGTVEEWLVEDGQLITVGMPLLRLATDKIDVDVEAEGEGRMLRVVASGATLEPGAVLGYLLAEGEAPPAGVTSVVPSPAAASENASVGSPAAAPVAAAGAKKEEAKPAAKVEESHRLVHVRRANSPHERR
jgi:pyruvate dehydrogenase E2 component (dihydrolipoamide acetyltransferase)